MMRYTFGTSGIAAERLKEIAKVFNPLAREFIEQHTGTGVQTALDLGCGPGFTTHMLKKATGCSQIYGFDLSDDFLGLARKQYPAYNFIRHDVTIVPFPVRAQVMYARFVLSHLKDTTAIVNAWTRELTDGGLLFIEELEDIFTHVGVFKEYLEANRGLVASQGANLFIGKTLGQGRYENTVVYNDCSVFPVLNRQAAAWFYPNTVTVWEKENYIKNNFTPARRKAISAELKSIMESKNKQSAITWRMRRMIMSRGE
jgi:trans-aconitate 2-methyltransferase